MSEGRKDANNNTEEEDEEQERNKERGESLHAYSLSSSDKSVHFTPPLQNTSKMML